MEKVWLENYEEGVPETIDIPSLVIPQLLERAAEKNPKKTALIFFGKELTYQEVDEQSQSFAANLNSLGMEKGDRIGLLLPNTPQFVISYFGALFAGAIPVTCNPLYTERELTHQLDDAGAKFLVTLDSKMLFEKAAKVQPKTEIQKIIVSNLKEYLPFPKSLLFPLIKRKELTDKGEIKTKEEEGSLVQFKNLVVIGALVYLIGILRFVSQKE